MRGIDYWRLADELTVIQAALLICGYDPTDLQDDVKYSKTKAPEGYVAVKHAIKSAIVAGILQGRETKVLAPDEEYYPDDDLALLNVDTIKDWMSSKGIRSHFFFFPEEPEGAYLSPTHPRYSPKLAAAVRAWQAMDDETLYTKNPKHSVQKWLRAHCSNYGLTGNDGNPLKSAIEEIAKIVNWNPKGGAPSTPSAVSSTEPTANVKALTALDENFAIREQNFLKSKGDFDLELDDTIPF